jgi:hypothetical protein
LGSEKQQATGRKAEQEYGTGNMEQREATVIPSGERNLKGRRALGIRFAVLRKKRL